MTRVPMILLPRIFLASVLAVCSAFATTIALAQVASTKSTPELVKACAPSVVTIETKGGSGSGVIVGSTGVIVTNLHVIRGLDSASVRLSNGDTYDDVLVVDVDARKDLAVIKIKAVGLRTVTIGDSQRIEVGERVIAIGSPRGLDTTVSEGIVSAIRDTGDGYRVFQTTAPISPGSSGGGLFSAKGELIGITTFKIRDSENLNFAVPANYVRGLLDTRTTMTLAEAAVRYPADGKSVQMTSDTGSAIPANSFIGRWENPRDGSSLLLEGNGTGLVVAFTARTGVRYASANLTYDAASASFSGLAEGQLPCSCGRQPRIEKVCRLSGVPFELKPISEGVLRGRTYQPHSTSCERMDFTLEVPEPTRRWTENLYGRKR